MEADRRAVEGVRSPIFDRNGNIVGHKIEYPDMFRMKKLDRAYRERSTVEMNIKPEIDREAVPALMRTPEGRELSRRVAKLIVNA